MARGGLAWEDTRVTRGEKNVYRPSPVELPVYPTLSLIKLTVEGGIVERRLGGVHMYLRGLREARAVCVYLFSRVLTGQTLP